MGGLGGGLMGRLMGGLMGPGLELLKNHWFVYWLLGNPRIELLQEQVVQDSNCSKPLVVGYYRARTVEKPHVFYCVLSSPGLE